MGIVLYPDMPEWNQLLVGIQSDAFLAVDLETSGLSPFTDVVAGAAFRCNGQSYYVPIGHKGLSARNVDAGSWAVLCQAIHGRPIVNHNIKFDIKFLIKHYGCRPKVYSDTMVLAHFVDSNQKLGLKPLAARWLRERPSFADIAGRSKNACLVPIDIIAPYAWLDVENVED